MRKIIGALGALVGTLLVVLAVALATVTAASAKSTPTVGTKVKVANGSVTFSAYDQPVSADNSGKDPADAGNEYAAAEVKACSTATKKQRITPFMFVLVLPDGSKEHATVTVKQPALFSALLGKGQCAQGWVTFEVPQGTRAKQLSFGVPGGTQYKWTVPTA